MKVCLYQQNEKMLKTSGIGRALRHQESALIKRGIEVTFDCKDTYDVIHINTLFKASYRLLKKCQKNNIPVITHAHSTIEDFKDSFRLWQVIAIWFNRCIYRMYRRSKLIVTPTEYSKKLIENYKGVDAKIIAISNGIDLEEYSYNEDNILRFKEYFDLKDDDKVVMGVGLYFKRKGLDDFIQVARLHPDVKFIWFGYLNKLITTSYINKVIKNKPDNVILPGFISGSIIKGAYLSAKAMLFPSREETEGIVVLEALASKTPLIVRDIPVYDGLLEDKINCLKGKTIEDFSNAVAFILNNDITEITINGYNSVNERSIENISYQLEQVYIDAINKNTI